MKDTSLKRSTSEALQVPEIAEFRSPARHIATPYFLNHQKSDLRISAENCCQYLLTFVKQCGKQFPLAAPRKGRAGRIYRHNVPDFHKKSKAHKTRPCALERHVSCVSFSCDGRVQRPAIARKQDQAGEETRHGP
jgi:hypothetical protein